MPNKYIILLIDACHAGFLVDHVAEADRKGKLEDHRVRVFTSADTDEWAFEGDDHGMFTEYLLKHPMTEQKGIANAAEAERMAKDVAKSVRQDTGDWQTPRFIEVGGHALKVKERKY